MNKWSQESGPKMLKNERGIISGEVIGRLESNVVQNEWADDTIDYGDAQLMQILRAQTLGHT